ncbi:GmrSD restriction endonuclease domain-containing protein [Streptomyces sp. 1222.5]|uniref:GmrSD restriction endonuclease domain-containing protein n=1 Tax=Streptomyces sp. 1222.5 TaxID=1881026 RepID=UPI003D75A8CA
MFKEDPVFKALPESIGSLVVAIQRGTIALPDFQRNFVWEPKRTVELLKSVISRYPAGTLLTWEQKDEANFGYRLFHGVAATGRRPARLVLDGQQRLTSMYQALTGVGDHRFFIRVWPFVDRAAMELRPLDEVDLDDAIFAHDSRRRSRFNPNDQEWQIKNATFPVAEYDRLRPWFKKLARSVEPDRDAADDLEELLNQFRDKYLQPLESYAFPVVDLPVSTPLVAVCNIFETLNRSGKELTPFDLLTAKFYPQGVHLRDLWSEAIARYPLLQEFKVDAYGILQALSLRARGSAQRSDVLNKLTAQDVSEHWEATVSGMSDVLDFLKRQCGAVSPEWLPYGMILVPMAAVFPEITDLRSQAKATAMEKLGRFYWCSVFTENYDQGANSQAGADYKALRAWLFSDEEKRVPEAVAEFNLSDTDLLLARFNRKALFRGLMTLLVREGARDFGTAQAISNLPPMNLDTLRVFAKSAVSVSEFEDAELCDAELALNRILVDRGTRKDVGDRPLMEYIEAQDAGTQRKLIEAVESHFIEAGEGSGLASQSYELFLRERLTQIVDLIEVATGCSIVYEGS